MNISEKLAEVEQLLHGENIIVHSVKDAMFVKYKDDEASLDDGEPIVGKYLKATFEILVKK